MGKSWNGVEYNMDFEPIDTKGNVLGPKDEAASAGWTSANEPWRDSPGWNAQPLSAEQSAGSQAANPAAWDARVAFQSANPVNAIGGPLGGGTWKDALKIGPTRRTLAAATPAYTPGGDLNGFEPWLMGGGVAPIAAPQGSSGGRAGSLVPTDGESLDQSLVNRIMAEMSATPFHQASAGTGDEHVTSLIESILSNLGSDDALGGDSGLSRLEALLSAGVL